MNSCSGCGQNHQRENQRYCNACHAKYMRENRRKHHELHPEARLKANARAYANVYLRRGKLTKQPCKCGSLDAEMHHADYTKPTEVTWLCRKCHLLLHVEQ